MKYTLIGTAKLIDEQTQTTKENLNPQFIGAQTLHS